MTTDTVGVEEGKDTRVHQTRYARSRTMITSLAELEKRVYLRRGEVVVDMREVATAGG